MSQDKNAAASPLLAEQPDSFSEPPKKLPSLAGIFHFIWLRKWAALIVWLFVAIPAGILLSIFNLPKSYSSASVLRFPSVVGAQTNVMRDIAITQGESIISIFQSFQVLDATVRKLGLRMRLATPHVFRKDAFKSLQYTESLGLGDYYLSPEGGDRYLLTYKPEKSNSSYVLFKGPAPDGRISVAGLDIELAPGFKLASRGESVRMRLLSHEKTIAALKKAVSTRALGASNFEIRLKDRDPWLVADIVNTMREQFLEVYYGTTEVQDVGILVQMEKDLELSKQRLEKSQDELSRYYAAHPQLARQEVRGDNLSFLESRQNIELLSQRRTRVQTAMAAKDLSGTGEKKFFWASELLQAMSEAGEPKANILRASLGEMNTRQAALRTSLGPEHPRILEVEKEREQLYLQMEEAYAELIRRLDKEIADWKVRYAASAPSSNPIPVKVTLELDRLNAVNQNNQAIYDRLLEAYNRAKLVTGSEFFKVTVVDPARPALYEPPSLRTRLIIAFVAVFLLGILVLAGFLAWPILFIRIWTKEDVVRLLNLRHLGSVPLRRFARRKRAAGRPAKAAGGTGGGKGAKGENGGGEADAERAGRPDGTPGQPDPMLLFHGSSYQIEDVEAFRIVREEVENAYRPESRNGRYCLMVTSCHPHEGKSICASNLAVAFARKGKRTLIVDADFRLGRLHEIFNLQVQTGLDDILRQQDLSPSRFLESAPMAFQTTAQMNLVVAPRRIQNANAGELVASDRFKAFIRMVREEFDVVIIDTPPVLITPEPLSLAEVAGGVVFVCRSGITTASEAREAVDTFLDRNLRVAVILNAVRDTFFDRSRYRKYSYYYQVQSKSDAAASA